MANLRIVSDNAADRATLSASTEAGSLVVENLLTETKSEVWRSTGASATLTAEWTDPETIGCVALPFCSLSSSATIRVRGYANAADVTALFDTGAQLASGYSPFGSWAWGIEPLGVNAYSYGGGAYGCIWFDQQAVRKLVIDLDDADNALGYIEASRLVTGAYWSPQYNAPYGVQITAFDASKHERTDGGDLKTDIGTRHNGISVDLSVLPPDDRNKVWQIFRRNGMSRPVFFSLLPQSGDPVAEQMYQIYGKLSRMQAMTYQFAVYHATQIEIEEV